MISQRALRNHERDLRALKLRQTGMSYTDIARACGFKSKQNAFAAVKTLINRHEAESVEELRAIENLRIDALQEMIWPDVTPPDAETFERMDTKALIAAKASLLETVDRVLRIMERRAKLNGLDAPVQTENKNIDEVRVVFVDGDLTQTDDAPGRDSA